MRLLSFYVRAGDATISFTEFNLGVSLLRSCGYSYVQIDKFRVLGVRFRGN